MGRRVVGRSPDPYFGIDPIEETILHPATTESSLRPQLWRVCLLFLVVGVVFFPLILNPITIGIFSKSDAERLLHVEDNWATIRLLFTGMGVADVGLGIALSLWGRRVSSIHSERQARAAVVAAWLGLGGGAISLVTRWYLWTQDAIEFHEFFNNVPAWAISIQLAAFLMLSASMVTLGVLMVKGPMPRWLGIVFAACGLLVYPTGLLPLFFYVGAIVLGAAGLRRYRAAGPLAEAGMQASPATV